MVVVSDMSSIVMEVVSMAMAASMVVLMVASWTIVGAGGKEFILRMMLCTMASTFDKEGAMDQNKIRCFPLSTINTTIFFS